MNHRDAIRELRRDPSTWLQYDEETRHLLKQAARNDEAAKDFDPAIAGCPSMMG